MGSDRDERPVTEDELDRARSFVQTRLEPDLRAAQDELQRVQDLVGQYEELSKHIAQVRSQMRSQSEVEAYVHLSTKLESGIEVPTRYNAQSEMIVSLGLGDLYISMPQTKAKNFSNAKIEQLHKREELQKQKVASIQAVMELTKSTLTKLEALRSGEEKSVLQDVPESEKVVGNFGEVNE